LSCLNNSITCQQFTPLNFQLNLNQAITCTYNTDFVDKSKLSLNTYLMHTASLIKKFVALTAAKIRQYRKKSIYNRQLNKFSRTYLHNFTIDNQTCAKTKHKLRMCCGGGVKLKGEQDTENEIKSRNDELENEYMYYGKSQV